jgi:UDP-N-acetylmuramate--alanine ligase
VTAVRGAASIGSGLAAARPARPLRPGERIHVVGAAGAGASAAVILGHQAGARMSGCDPGGHSPYTPAIEALGISLAGAHDPRHVTVEPRPERLAVTKALTAIDPHNPELEAARAAAIPLEPWQQVIADVAADRTLVAVAGTHGKSTTSGWLVHLLVEAGLDPCAFVGALLPGSLTGGLPSTARWGRGAAFIVEADEYAGNFDPYRPAIAVLTSAEWDHPDVFADGRAVVDCFVAWLEAAGRSAGPGAEGPVLVANTGNEGVRAVVDELRKRRWVGRIAATALTETGHQAAPGKGTLMGRILSAGPDGTTIEIGGAGLTAPFSAHLRLAGRHNAANALGVVGAALALGVSAEAVAAGLSGFSGVGRRLERKGEGRGVVVYDDYGHHPTAIAETLAALRQLEPGRRVWAVYEPLTYHRTAAMLEQFAAVLATADGVAVADIWASRDPDTSITSAAALAQAVAERRPGIVAVAPGSVEATAAWLADRVRPNDAVLVMGGGRSYRIAELLLEALVG